MKKLFSLLLVVAMIASLSVVSFAAPANQAGGMHTVITETDEDITVKVIVKNVVNCNGITSYIVTDKVSYVADSVVVGEAFAAGTWDYCSTCICRSCSDLRYFCKKEAVELYENYINSKYF